MLYFFYRRRLPLLIARFSQYWRQHGTLAALKLIFNRLLLIDKFVSLFLVKKIRALKALNYLTKYKSPEPLPLVSVIIPNYNGIEVGLERLLESLKKQTYPHIEIVCVDSSSTDDSLALLERYGAKIITIPKAEFRHDTSRNLGAQNAKGDFLLFTVNDACFDDPRWVEMGVHTLLCFKGTSYSTPQRFDDAAEPYARLLAYNLAASAGPKGGLAIYGGNLLAPLAFYLASPILRAGSIHVDDVNHLVRRDFFLKNPYRTHTCEDMDFGFRLIEKGGRFIYSSLSSVLHYHSYTNRKKYFTRVLVDLSVINRLIYKPIRRTRHGIVDMQIRAAMIVHQEIVEQIAALKNNGVKGVLLSGELRDFAEAHLEIDKTQVRADRFIHNLLTPALHYRDAPSMIFMKPLNNPETKALFINILGLKAPFDCDSIDPLPFVDMRDRYLHFVSVSMDILARRLGYQKLSLEAFENVLVLCLLNSFASLVRFSVSYTNDGISVNTEYLRSLEWQ